MTYRLSKTSIETAISHLCRYGDTDVFPHLPELAFFADECGSVAAELEALDLDNYMPGGAVEALAPKGRYSFRIVHQLLPLDTLLLLACVIEIGERIEAKRQFDLTYRAFSYRFQKQSAGQIYRNNRTFKDWLHRQKVLLKHRPHITHIVQTDISDFYARINHHRLENLLDEVAPGDGAAKFIKKHISAIRAKQSFGLPVGGSAARLLAELALTDTDQALHDRGLSATRFVDDFRIFLSTSDNPYDALGYLAEQLYINEGLSLNAAKTFVTDRNDFLKWIDQLTSDLEAEAEGMALDTLTARLYFDETPDEEDLERLKALHLVEMLKAEIYGDFDIGKIRIIFRALRIAKPADAIEFIKSDFSDLVMFAKELCLLMDALNDENDGCFYELTDNIIEAILIPPASSIQVIRTWLLEIFVRSIVKIPLSKLRKIEHLSSAIDKRQLLLIRGRCDDKNYFRKQKTATHNFSNIELSSLILGASCLPADEFEVWTKTLRPILNQPLGGLFLRWVVRNRPGLMPKLKRATVDAPE